MSAKALRDVEDEVVVLVWREPVAVGEDEHDLGGGRLGSPQAKFELTNTPIPDLYANTICEQSFAAVLAAHGFRGQTLNCSESNGVRR